MATELRTESVIDAIKQPLALIEDDARRRQAEAFVDAARLHVERAVFDLMSQLAQAVDERVNEHYRVRLAYRPGALALDVEEKVQDGDAPRWTTLEGDVEKITIRIPAELKDLAQQAAARAGTSANSWFIKALARAIRSSEQPPSQPPGRRERRHGHGGRLSGWIGGDED